MALFALFRHVQLKPESQSWSDRERKCAQKWAVESWKYLLKYRLISKYQLTGITTTLLFRQVHWYPHHTSITHTHHPIKHSTTQIFTYIDTHYRSLYRISMSLSRYLCFFAFLLIRNTFQLFTARPITVFNPHVGLGFGITIVVVVSSYSSYRPDKK